MDNIYSAIQLLQQPAAPASPIAPTNDPVLNAMKLLQSGNAQPPGLAEPAPTQAPLKIGAEGFPDALRQTLDQSGWLGRNLAGAGTALSNLWEGSKQISGDQSGKSNILDYMQSQGMPNPISSYGASDPRQIEANRIIENKAPIGSVAGNVALLAPTAAIPGANTVAGAGVVSALTGALQPTQGNESRGLNTVMGLVGGMGGQYAGNKLGAALTGRLADKSAEAAAEASRNSVRDATLKAAQEAGYKVPPSTVNPSFFNKRLEGLAGKAAIGQEFSIGNQDVTNAISREALGLPDNSGLSMSALEQLRNTAAAPYREVAALPAMPPVRTTGIGGYPLIGPAQQAPAEALKDLKQARFNANGYWNEFKRTGEVAARDKALAATQSADALDNYLEQTAIAAGKPDLVNALSNARREIAKSYSVEGALNTSTGEVDARILGRAIDKGKPLSDGLETAARFADAFPQYAREGSRVPTPGVSKSEWLASALLGTAGAIGGGPAGLSAALLPLVSPAARSLVLSKGYQGLMAHPDYSVGMATRALGQLTPERAGILARALLQSAPASSILQ